MTTVLSCALLCRRVENFSRPTFFIGNDDGSSSPYLISKRISTETSPYEWDSGYWMPEMGVNMVGKVTTKIKAKFSFWGQG